MATIWRVDDDLIISANSIALDTSDATAITEPTDTQQLKVATTGTVIGAATEGLSMKSVKVSGTVVVAVPSITDPDIAKVDADTSAMTFACAVGDGVLAIPLEALPTNCRLQGAWVTAADTVQVVFGSEGGNVTGANKNFKFVFFDLT